MSSKEDIERIKKIRALEPLVDAWDTWRKERGVRSFLFLFRISS
jgi:hypothetical protein